MVSYLLDDSLSMQDYHLIVSRPQNRVYAKYIHVSSYAFFSHKVGMYPRQKVESKSDHGNNAEIKGKH